MPVAVILFVGVAAQFGPDPPGLPDDVKCGWRDLAYHYGKLLRPDATEELRNALYSTLPANVSCGESSIASLDAPRGVHPSVPPSATVVQKILRVQAETGDDEADGSAERPLRSIQAAIDRCRLVDGACEVAVGAGVYHLLAPLYLDERDSGLSIKSVGGRAWLSGGVPLPQLSWHREGSSRIWSADLAGVGLDTIASLRVNGERSSPAQVAQCQPLTRTLTLAVALTPNPR